MRFKFSIRDAFIVVIAIIPLSYLAVVYPSLPSTVAIHFDLSGKPDNFGAKIDLVYSTLTLSMVALGIYLLLNYLPQIDPKKTARLGQPVFKKISVALVVVLSVFNILIIYASAHGSLQLSKLVFPFAGLFMSYMGNLMHSIKPNYFVGIRVPWTLEDPDNWRVTHQLAGKLFFVGGIVLAISTLLLPPKAALVVFISGIIVMVLIPVVYSFVYFKKHDSIK